MDQEDNNMLPRDLEQLRDLAGRAFIPSDDQNTTTTTTTDSQNHVTTTTTDLQNQSPNLQKPQPTPSFTQNESPNVPKTSTPYDDYEVILLFDRVCDLVNFRSMFRTAASLGIFNIWVVLNELPAKNRTIDLSAFVGTDLYHNIRFFDSSVECIEALGYEGYDILVSTLSPEAIPYELDGLTAAEDRLDKLFTNARLAEIDQFIANSTRNEPSGKLNDKTHKNDQNVELNDKTHKNDQKVRLSDFDHVPSQSEIDSEFVEIKTMVPTVPKRVALVVGREADGASTQMIASAHQQIYIPMVGFAESFNVGVAGAILLQRLVALIHYQHRVDVRAIDLGYLPPFKSFHPKNNRPVNSVILSKSQQVLQWKATQDNIDKVFDEKGSECEGGCDGDAMVDVDLKTNPNNTKTNPTTPPLDESDYHDDDDEYYEDEDGEYEVYDEGVGDEYCDLNKESCLSTKNQVNTATQPPPNSTEEPHEPQEPQETKDLNGEKEEKDLKPVPISLSLHALHNGACAGYDATDAGRRELLQAVGLPEITLKVLHEDLMMNQMALERDGNPFGIPIKLFHPLLVPEVIEDTDSAPIGAYIADDDDDDDKSKQKNSSNGDNDGTNDHFGKTIPKMTKKQVFDARKARNEVANNTGQNVAIKIERSRDTQGDQCCFYQHCLYTATPEDPNPIPFSEGHFLKMDQKLEKVRQFLHSQKDSPHSFYSLKKLNKDDEEEILNANNVSTMYPSVVNALLRLLVLNELRDMVLTQPLNTPLTHDSVDAWTKSTIKPNLDLVTKNSKAKFVEEVQTGLKYKDNLHKDVVFLQKLVVAFQHTQATLMWFDRVSLQYNHSIQHPTDAYDNDLSIRLNTTQPPLDPITLLHDNSKQHLTSIRFGELYFLSSMLSSSSALSTSAFRGCGISQQRLADLATPMKEFLGKVQMEVSKYLTPDVYQRDAQLLSLQELSETQTFQPPQNVVSATNSSQNPSILESNGVSTMQDGQSNDQQQSVALTEAEKMTLRVKFGKNIKYQYNDKTTIEEHMDGLTKLESYLYPNQSGCDSGAARSFLEAIGAIVEQYKPVLVPILREYGNTETYINERSRQSSSLSQHNAALGSGLGDTGIKSAYGREHYSPISNLTTTTQSITQQQLTNPGTQSHADGDDTKVINDGKKEEQGPDGVNDKCDFDSFDEKDNVKHFQRSHPTLWNTKYNRTVRSLYSGSNTTDLTHRFTDLISIPFNPTTLRNLTKWVSLRDLLLQGSFSSVPLSLASFILTMMDGSDSYKHITHYLSSNYNSKISNHDSSNYNAKISNQDSSHYNSKISNHDIDQCQPNSLCLDCLSLTTPICTSCARQLTAMLVGSIFNLEVFEEGREAPISVNQLISPRLLTTIHQTITTILLNTIQDHTSLLTSNSVSILGSKPLFSRPEAFQLLTESPRCLIKNIIQNLFFKFAGLRLLTPPITLPPNHIPFTTTAIGNGNSPNHASMYNNYISPRQKFFFMQQFFQLMLHTQTITLPPNPPLPLSPTPHSYPSNYPTRLVDHQRIPIIIAQSNVFTWAATFASSQILLNLLGIFSNHLPLPISSSSFDPESAITNSTAKNNVDTANSNVDTAKNNVDAANSNMSNISLNISPLTQKPSCAYSEAMGSTSCAYSEAMGSKNVQVDRRSQTDPFLSYPRSIVRYTNSLLKNGYCPIPVAEIDDIDQLVMNIDGDEDDLAPDDEKKDNNTHSLSYFEFMSLARRVLFTPLDEIQPSVDYLASPIPSYPQNDEENAVAGKFNRKYRMNPLIQSLFFVDTIFSIFLKSFSNILTQLLIPVCMTESEIEAANVLMVEEKAKLVQIKEKRPNFGKNLTSRAKSRILHRYGRFRPSPKVLIIVDIIMEMFFRVPFMESYSERDCPSSLDENGNYSFADYFKYSPSLTDFKYSPSLTDLKYSSSSLTDLKYSSSSFTSPNNTFAITPHPSIDINKLKHYLLGPLVPSTPQWMYGDFTLLLIGYGMRINHYQQLKVLRKNLNAIKIDSSSPLSADNDNQKDTAIVDESKLYTSLLTKYNECVYHGENVDFNTKDDTNKQKSLPTMNSNLISSSLHPPIINGRPYTIQHNDRSFIIPPGTNNVNLCTEQLPFTVDYCPVSSHNKIKQFM